MESHKSSPRSFFRLDLHLYKILMFILSSANSMMKKARTVRRSLPTTKAMETNPRSGMISGDGVDSISGLPEPIIHQVMSRLSPKEVARIPVLSKQFKFFWSSFPIIVFDQALFRKNAYNRLRPEAETDRFLEYVKNAVQLRRLNTVIEKFHLKFDQVKLTSDSRVDDIICFALENKVQELVLDIIPSGYVKVESFKLMEGIKSSSLAVLKLTGLQVDIDLLISSCPSLKSLSLCDCSVIENQLLGNTSHRSLKMLSFRTSKITDKWIEERVSKFVNLEILEVRFCKCKKLRNIRVTNEKLEKLDLSDCYLLESIEVVAPNLRSLHFANNACVTGEWLKAQIYSLPYLENLKLVGCKKLEWVEIFNDGLQSLELLDCPVGEVVVDAIKLHSFKYRGEVTLFTLMNSPGLRNPTLTLIQESQTVRIPEWNSLRNLLSVFSHCEILTLVCSSHKDFIIHEDIRATRLPPLCDVKHLRIKVHEGRKIDAEWVDNFLWLSPHLESLCILEDSGKEKIIKFRYEKERKIREDFCCRGLPLKCWRDDLKYVELQNFEADDQDRLSTYFGQSAKILEPVLGNKRRKYAELQNFGAYYYPVMFEE